MRLLRLLLLLACRVALNAQWGGELRMCLRTEPLTFHPLLVDDSASETIRSFTGGVLARMNSVSPRPEPELAVSWKVSQGGRAVSFRLREGVRFSDGTPFSAEDVAYTMEVLSKPDLHGPIVDSFHSDAGVIRTVVSGPAAITILFPRPLADPVRLLGQVAIMSRTSALKEGAVLGPFWVAEHKAGAYIRLQRNPYYWKTEGGRRLPYLDAVRLDVQSNGELELLRFRRGEIDLINGLNADHYVQLAKQRADWVKDAGPSLENEFLWFNMSGRGVPEYETAWFRSREFRLAVSHAIRRDDLCRLVFQGHASPGAGPFPPANRFWVNGKLAPHRFDLARSRQLLKVAGFAEAGGTLRDREGHAVEFSLITNGANKARERMAALLQQDLAAVGMKVSVVSLDFPSLLERISKTMRYEACLLGLNNVDPDPNGQMTVWLSSGSNHAWNPRQSKPSTEWEAEMDRLMQAQAQAVDPAKRKASFDKVQQIVLDQAPILYLAYRDALLAISPVVKNAQPSLQRPQVVWNIDRVSVSGRP
jgi:peptide/nickel transport system substrate-binding protein